MKRYNVLKDCVIESKFYQCGTVYTDACDTANKPYISVLLEHGFMKEMREQPKTVWDLKDGDTIQILDEDGRIFTGRWDKWYEDERKCGNVFLTEKDAQNELACRKAKVILERDTKGFKAYKNTSPFYIVYYDLHDGRLRFDKWDTDQSYGEFTSRLVFQSKEDAEASIKAHEKEWMIYLGVEVDD